MNYILTDAMFQKSSMKQSANTKEFCFLKFMQQREFWWYPSITNDGFFHKKNEKGGFVLYGKTRFDFFNFWIAMSDCES